MVVRKHPIKIAEATWPFRISVKSAPTMMTVRNALITL